MKICTYCYSQNDDSATECLVCGSPLPVSNNGSKKKKMGSGGKGFLGTATQKIIAGVAAVAVTIGGVVAVVSGTGSSAQVSRAATRNEEAIVAGVERLPNLMEFVDAFGELYDDGSYTASAMIRTNDFQLSGVVDYARKSKIMDGTLAYANPEDALDIEFVFSANKKEFLLASDNVSADVYGFKLKEFQKKYSKSVMAKVIPLPVSSDSEINLFEKLDLGEQIGENVEEAWANFKKTIEVNEINERQMQIGNETQLCRAYEITWDAKAATKLIGAIFGNEDSFLNSLSGLFSKLDPDCRCYINEEGYIVAVDFVTAGNKCTIIMEGEDNPWDKCTLTSASITGGSGPISGSLTMSDTEICAEIHWDEQLQFDLYYNDNIGSFEVGATTGQQYQGITGHLTIEGDSAAIRFNSADERTVVDVALAPQEEKPEELAKKYVDLMDMGINDWQRLLIEISN